MTQLDYTWERREKLIRAEEYEEGVERGIEIVQKLKQGIPPETLLAQGVDEGVIRKAMLLL